MKASTRNKYKLFPHSGDTLRKAKTLDFKSITRVNVEGISTGVFVRRHRSVGEIKTTLKSTLILRDNV